MHVDVVDTPASDHKGLGVRWAAMITHPKATKVQQFLAITHSKTLKI